MQAVELKYNKYEAYKDSGINWLGKIPVGWSLKRIKFLFNEINERSFDGAEELLSVSQYTGVTKKSEKVGAGELLTNASTLEGYKIVCEGDLVTNIMLAWNGSLGFSPFNGITSPAYSIYRLKSQDDKRFFHYLFRTELYKSEFKRNSSGVIESRLRLYTDDFFNIWSILPPLQEQTAIANFLDNKTTKIDTAIAQKEKMIELLKERKQIMIQNAVTKGLDPNAKMKDSGVEWIGEIPKNWEVEPIKYSLKGVIDCEHKTAPFVDEKDYFVVRTSNVKDGKLTFDNAKYTHQKGFLEWTERGIPTPGDILLTREAPAGEACLVPNKVQLCLGQRMVWLKVDKTRLIPQLGIYFIYSSVGRTYIDFLSAGSTVLHFNMADIKNIPIINIPLEEQTQIVSHIESQSAKIDKAIALQQTQIEKLKEYKATLIDSAVTGKIKVC
ncbi:restriction endonuclease subunit S [uncultured Sunxiuqinia sp.]|uniref:restriction endonuclease subunit S n=1 Tax=uncultured Sunxiuqinia sp. TaxID=1573825 RepID=UPI002AA7A1E2|nr:restriction endonuclease subunit S [uncultured Sunxiuqinia sp.]